MSDNTGNSNNEQTSSEQALTTAQSVNTALPTINIEDELKQSFIDYAMSVIVDRALPDVRDGLKPVHRRVLFDMYDLKVWSSGQTKKSARIVGDVIGRFHPHGDAAVYETIVRMAQWFAMREPLMFGQGNFGNIDGDGAAAMRYTEVKMTKIAEQMLEDIEKDTVNHYPNYDGSEQIPEVLPAKFPNLLVNGSSGIAVGMATNIPTHNLSEVIDGTIAVLDNPDISLDELMQHIPGPDFPTGGIIVGNDGIRQAYQTGKGRCIIRAKTRIETDKSGRQTIIVDEIPYAVHKVDIVKQIVNLVKDKKIEGISEVQDESGKDYAVRIAIELKRDAFPEAVLNNLYQQTLLQSSFPINMVALVNNHPRQLSLKQILDEFVKFRREIVTRRTVFDLRQSRRSAHVNEGLMVARANLQKIIDIITNADNVEDARIKLMAEPWDGSLISTLIHRSENGENIALPQGIPEDRGLIDGKYFLSEPQARAILDLRLSKLTHLAQEEIRNKYAELVGDIKEFLDILNNPERMKQEIRNELLEVREIYGNARKSEFTVDLGKIDKGDLITRRDVIVTLSAQGYIKYQDISTYESQGRGGKGKLATKLKDDDYVTKVVVASTHDKMMFFTNKGRAFVSVVYDLPTSETRTSKGLPLQNFFNIDRDNGEVVTALLPISEFNAEQFFFMATKKGLVKKTSLAAYASFVNRMNANGIIAVKLNEGDELIGVELCSGDDDVFLFTSNGYAQHFCEFYKGSALSDDSESDAEAEGSQDSSDESNEDTSIDRHSGSGVRPSGRGSGCIRGIKIRDNGTVVSLMVVAPSQLEQQCLIATANGYGKRLRLSEIALRNRGGMGVIVMRNIERNGNIIGAVCADDNADFMLITNQGQLLRSAMADTPLIGRYGAGNILMRMNEGDNVIALQSIPEDVVENSRKMAEARQKELEELKALKDAANGLPQEKADTPDNPQEQSLDADNTENTTQTLAEEEDNK
ncbi:MAG: DNA gyrase subunit A [Succinivibrio sp.]